MLGTTKLIGARIKLEQNVVKDRNKIKDLQDEVLAINLKVAENGGVLEEQQLRRW